RSQHWDNRSQAYDWARQHLLNGASSYAVAGLDPNSTDGRVAGLRSFLVANRIFVYWLDSRSSEQSLLMEQIYKTFPPLAVHLGWFIDESSGVKLTSIAAMPVLATDFFSNLEVWTSSPVLSQAAPVMAAYYARTAKSTDELIAGPSGAGYMFPSEWRQEQLPAFLQLTEQMMKSMNLTTLEMLDMSDEKIGGQPIS